MHRSKKTFFHFFTLDVEHIYDLIDKEIKGKFETTNPTKKNKSDNVKDMDQNESNVWLINQDFKNKGLIKKVVGIK